MKRNVVFLDVDGVLNSQRTLLVCGQFPHPVEGGMRSGFDPIACRLINMLVRDTDALLVMHSSWRTNLMDGALYAQWKDATNILVDEFLPDGPKGSVITKFLKDNKEAIQRCVIIDDFCVPVFGQEACLHVAVDSMNGFGSDNFIAAMKWLNPNYEASLGYL